MSNRILVVDDDPMTHKLLGFALKDDHYNFKSLLNGEDAREFLQKNHRDVDAVILDWEMPGLNGLELLKWLKSKDKYKDIPVVMLTAHTDKDDIKQGIDAGAYYYLTKPFNKDLLRSIVSVAISDYRHLKELNEQLKDARNPFSNLINGKVQIRTLNDAQKYSVFVANACPQPEKVLIIAELLINAIEHGNLGISYKEKSKLIDEERLTEEIDQRLNQPENKDKHAVLEFAQNGDNIEVTIEDQGKGFNYKKYLDFDEDRVFDNHGRGIAMVNSMLDIRYFGKGNKVKVKIPTSAN